MSSGYTAVREGVDEREDSSMTEAARTVAVAFLGLAAGLTWYAFRTAAIPTTSPDRLVAELRLSQFAALLLALISGAYIGFAVWHETQPGVGLDIALSIGFLVMAATTLVRDPRHALTVLALTFAAHALFDVGHRPGALADGIAPTWYLIACAVYDVYIGALCYLPILRR
jgi:hypothetical protein